MNSNTSPCYTWHNRIINKSKVNKYNNSPNTTKMGQIVTGVSWWTDIPWRLPWGNPSLASEKDCFYHFGPKSDELQEGQDYKLSS